MERISLTNLSRQSRNDLLQAFQMAIAGAGTTTMAVYFQNVCLTAFCGILAGLSFTAFLTLIRQVITDETQRRQLIGRLEQAREQFDRQQQSNLIVRLSPTGDQLFVGEAEVEPSVQPTVQQIGAGREERNTNFNEEIPTVQNPMRARQSRVSDVIPTLPINLPKTGAGIPKINPEYLRLSRE